MRVNILSSSRDYFLMNDWRERLATEMRQQGFTAVGLSKEAGVSRTMVNDILNKGSTPSVDNLFRIASVLGLSIDQLYLGQASVFAQIQIDGVTTLPGRWRRLEKGEEKVFDLPTLDNMVSVLVDNDAVQPYVPGDMILGTRIEETNADNRIVGRECICCAADGTLYVAYPERGAVANRFNLRFYDPRIPIIEDATLLWAAPVKMIIRNAVDN